MKFGDTDTDRDVFLVAEIGNNHEGDYSLAEEMLGRAAEAGVGAVKFQTFVPEHYVSSSDTARLERLRKFQLSRDEFERLSKLADRLGVIFFSTPFDIDSARFLDTIQPIFKISSGDNTFFPLIDVVAGFGKPLIISTGLSRWPILERIERDVRGTWRDIGSDAELAFLHCVTCYPVPREQTSLGVIPTLRRRFPECVIGYSDHTLGVDAALHAVAAGARIVEKHFTLDKNYSDFRDHSLSADPAEMRRIVEGIQTVTDLLGSGDLEPRPCEQTLDVAVRRSIAAARDLPAGTVIALEDLTWVRPGSGVPAGQENRVIGRTLSRAVGQGVLIRTEDLISR